ncbi:MAG: OmpA family protein [Gammaproteobacteria bacterium]
MGSRARASLLAGSVIALAAGATEPRVIESGETIDPAELAQILSARPVETSATRTRSIRKADGDADEFALRIEFAFDSAAIPEPAIRQLDAIASAVQQLAGEPVIVIVGHTDAVGPAAYNAVLSRRRAEAVRDYLLARGIPAARLEAQGAGEQQPLVLENPTDARNRRVQFRRADGG